MEVATVPIVGTVATTSLFIIPSSIYYYIDNLTIHQITLLKRSLIYMDKTPTIELIYELKTPANLMVATAIRNTHLKGPRQWAIFAETILFGNKNRFQAMMVGSSVDMIEAMMITAQWKEYFPGNLNHKNCRYFYTSDLMGFTDLLPLTEDMQIPIKLHIQVAGINEDGVVNHIYCRATVDENAEGVINPISCDHYLTIHKMHKDAPYCVLNYHIGSLPRANDRSSCFITDEIKADINDEDIYTPGTIYEMTVTPKHLIEMYGISYARITPLQD